MRRNLKLDFVRLLRYLLYPLVGHADQPDYEPTHPRYLAELVKIRKAKAALLAEYARKSKSIVDEIQVVQGKLMQQKIRRRRSQENVKAGTFTDKRLEATEKNLFLSPAVRTEMDYQRQWTKAFVNRAKQALKTPESHTDKQLEDRCGELRKKKEALSKHYKRLLKEKEAVWKSELQQITNDVYKSLKTALCRAMMIDEVTLERRSTFLPRGQVTRHDLDRLDDIPSEPMMPRHAMGRMGSIQEKRYPLGNTYGIAESDFESVSEVSGPVSSHAAKPIRKKRAPTAYDKTKLDEAKQGLPSGWTCHLDPELGWVKYVDAHDPNNTTWDRPSKPSVKKHVRSAHTPSRARPFGMDGSPASTARSAGSRKRSMGRARAPTSSGHRPRSHREPATSSYRAVN